MTYENHPGINIMVDKQIGSDGLGRYWQASDGSVAVWVNSQELVEAF